MQLDMWLAFLLAATVISLSPGAGAVNTMSNGMRYGVWHTLPAILGLQAGYGAQIVLVGVGLGAVIASSVVAFTLIKWFGVAYLVYLGYCKWRDRSALVATESEQPDVSGWRRFWQAALVNLTNPKATVFLVALFPQFIDANAPQTVQLLVMGLTLLGVDIVVMLGYATLAARLSRLVRSQRHVLLLNRLFGGLFMAAGAMLASVRH